MPSLHARIFVSYRRDDASGYALGLSRELIGRFGRDEVFIDLGNIGGGEDFERRIKDAVESCHVLLLVISPQWLLEIKEKRHRFRTKDERDWVKFEIETAFSKGRSCLAHIRTRSPNAKRSRVPGNSKKVIAHKWHGNRRSQLGG